MQSTQQEIGLLVLGVYNLIIYLLFLGLYVKRVNKLDKLASSHVKQDLKLKVRVVGIICLVFLEGLHIILSYCDPSYYMYDKRNFSLIDALCMFDLILQIYIITRQHKKKTRRSKTVALLWFLMMLQYIVAIIIVQVFAPNNGIVLLIFQLILCLLLIILTYMNQPNQLVSLQSFRQSNIESNLFPNSETASQSSKKSMTNQRIFVEFNKQFQVSLMKDYYECAFKIAVYVCDKFHIINKSETQFIKLSKDMIEMFPNSIQVRLGQVSRAKNCTNIMKYGQQRQKIYQNYLINLTKSQQFYAQPLMNFLQIHSERRNILKKAKGALIKKDRETVLTYSQQKVKKPFFNVTWKDNRILVSNPQIIQFYINKQINQIILFHNRLVAQKRLQFQFISEEPDRGQLCHFIQRLVNSKYFWPCFAEWMCLGSAIQEKVMRMFDFWVYGFQNLDMSVIGYQTHFDKNNSVVYYYLLSIQNKIPPKQTHNSSRKTSFNNNNNNNSSLKEGIMLKKRYNDFVKLNGYVKRFLTSQNIKNVRIPQLPPKFSPFESKTSPNSRRVYFDTYIKEIIKIQGINHCIKLLQFFQIENDSVFQLMEGKKEEQFIYSPNQMNENEQEQLNILDQTHLDSLGT